MRYCKYRIARQLINAAAVVMNIIRAVCAFRHSFFNNMPNDLLFIELPPGDAAGQDQKNYDEKAVFFFNELF